MTREYLTGTRFYDFLLPMQATNVLVKKVLKFTESKTEGGVKTESEITRTHEKTFDFTATVVITKEMVNEALGKSDDSDDLLYELHVIVGREATKIISDRYGFGITEKSRQNFMDGHYWENSVENGEFKGLVIGVGYSHGLPESVDLDEAEKLIGVECLGMVKSVDSTWSYAGRDGAIKRAKWEGKPLPDTTTEFRIEVVGIKVRY